MLSDVVGERIMTWRKRRGLNRETLAERCAALGMNLTAESFTNIESGRRKEGVRRRTITVDELMVIALALDVPPLVLLVPYPDQDTVELSPGRTLPVYEAVEWISGEAYEFPTDGSTPTLLTEWLDGAKPLLFLRAFRREMDTYGEIFMELRTAQEIADRATYLIKKFEADDPQLLDKARLTARIEQEKADHLKNQLAEVRQRLADMAATMAAEGCPPPPPSADAFLENLEGNEVSWGTNFHTRGESSKTVPARISLNYRGKLRGRDE
jgi:transcriptional regulator with XRE-family HTH domain